VVLAALLLSAAVSLQATPAFAAGAVAVGVGPRGPASGYAIGYGFNQPNADAAKKQALQGCHGSTVTSGDPVNDSMRQARKNCRVVGTFDNQCIASAIDPKDGTPGVGWAVGNTQKEADEQALARCKSTAGSGREAFCTVEDRRCDGAAK